MSPGAPRRPARSLRVRIVAAFLAAQLVMLGAIGYLVAQQRPLHDNLRLVTEGYLPLSTQVARLKRDQERVQRDLNRINRGGRRPPIDGTSSAEIYTQELKDNLAIARIRIQGLRARTRDPAEQAVLAKAGAYLDTIEELFERYEADSRQYLEQIGEGADEELARLRYMRPLRTTGKRLGEEFQKLELTLDGRVSALTSATEAAQQRATAVALSLALGATGLAAALVVAVLVALRPIVRLTEQVTRLAAGDYGDRVEVSGGDEVSVLAAEVNAMADAIESRDRRLKERAEELDRLSAYLSSVVDTLEDGLVVVEEGVVSLTNPAATRAWGTAEGEPVPEPLVDAVTRPGLVELEGQGGALYSIRCARFGDRGTVAVLGEITDQVRARERLARSERLALIGQMLAQITHEVRNPLNALSLNAELLADELGDLDADRTTEAWDLLEMITGEVERLTAVTGHYLQLARRPPARLEPTDLAALLEDVVRLLEPEIEAHGATLSVDVAPVGEVSGDGNQLRRAVLNVVRNAIEAGAHTLALSSGRGDGEAWIRLEDDGPGMSEAEVGRATDPFFSTKASGTGLGLAITRQILEDHGGRVEVTSTVGEGTTVTLVWPVS